MTPVGSCRRLGGPRHCHLDRPDGGDRSASAAMSSCHPPHSLALVCVGAAVAAAVAAVGRTHWGRARWGRARFDAWATMVDDNGSTRLAVGFRTVHPRRCRCFLTTGLCPVVVSCVRRYRTVFVVILPCIRRVGVFALLAVIISSCHPSHIVALGPKPLDSWLMAFGPDSSVLLSVLPWPSPVCLT